MASVPVKVNPKREIELESVRGPNTGSENELSSSHNALMVDGSLEALAKSVELTINHTQRHEIAIQFRNLTFWNEIPKLTIRTVGSTFLSFFFGGEKKERINVVYNLTGRILPKRMSLVVGPPGSGKSTFLKALSGHLHVGSAHLEGEILYNSESVDCGKFLINKIATYSDEKEEHAGSLTVRETLEFAWRMTTGGHHSCGVARDAVSAAVLDQADPHMVHVHNTLKMLGLFEAADTLVGDSTIRGISGGQKRRVTLGEMLLPPRTIKFLDAISNGLDAATTYDIVQSLQLLNNAFGHTTVISLLQPTPEVFYTFDDVIVMADGQIIYHGPTTSVLDYFKDLGYHCPEIMDVADFLQEVPTADGKRFTIGSTTKNGSTPPCGAEALVQAWKGSALFQAMLEEMDVQARSSTGKWPPELSQRYPASVWFTLKYVLGNEATLLYRNSPFLTGRAIQSVAVGVITGTLFSNLAVEDTTSMNGMLFFISQFTLVAGASSLPLIFAQRAVFYKHSKALFYDPTTLVLAQAFVMAPILALEALVVSVIVYWSVGMSGDYHSSRFWIFTLVVFVFSLFVAQLHRVIGAFMPSPILAEPLSGVLRIVMILFGGYIIPKNLIPPGWIWFYWMNPLSHALKAFTVNEYTAPDYDFMTCTATDAVTGTCTNLARFGDLALASNGYPTDQQWVWYSIAVIVGFLILLLILNILIIAYVRLETTPPPPIVLDYSERGDEKVELVHVEIPFEPATFAFKDVSYTVSMPTGEDLDLLKGVSGFFEPGTVTALMGSSGAGKTTLLDVLSGRKNTGVIKGNIYVNGHPKIDRIFKRMMGYVEQTDSLSPNDTAREAVEFSAALRLPRDTPADIRAAWVTTVLTMLELIPLENTMVGNSLIGGMSFEQKKRLSIAVVLAANPAILFLDEPTTGLDSRAAQVVIRCIKRVAASGRSIVCTIHQPSAVIFDAFDSLLLLKSGGQTVFFGELGAQSSHLISYFEGLPGVVAKENGVNPATWMLDVIGAGTSSRASDVDFHQQYIQSALCSANSGKLLQLIACSSEGRDLASLEAGEAVCGARLQEPLPTTQYAASHWVQLCMLTRRFFLAYWRNPDYNFVRMVICILIALIFSSAYANQQHLHTDIDVIARGALVYVTLIFLGVVSMMSSLPVMFALRPAFYREQFSEIYDVRMYTLAGTLVELPYVALSSLLFVLPYFFIAGWASGDVAAKFFWYWLFQGLYMLTNVSYGHLLSFLFPSAESANVMGGTSITLFVLFCGFSIHYSDFPDFWVFMYWLNPVHYALEGILSTQFNHDHSLITITGTGEVMTAQSFVENFFSDWHYSARGFDIMALVLFFLFNRVVAYVAQKYLRHDQR